MKRSIFLNKVLVICSFLCFVSCTQDSDISDNVTEKIDEKRRPRVVDIDKTMEVLIEFKQGTSEYVKRKKRHNYSNTGLLLSWVQCEIEDNDDVETWIVDAMIFHSYKPGPIQHSNDDDVDRVTLNANCKDYKKD